tara:strand:- start:14262 stop:15434 length:1173 start_codon:yes stop_codon:yes gene_type:complete
MKPLYITLVSTLILFSCGSKENTQTVAQTLASNDLTIIQAKRLEISAKQQELALQLKQLDAKISILDTSKKMPLITTFNAKNEVFEHFLELQGSVNTKTNLVIYPEYSGILQAVFVKEGQYVSKGQTLAKIDDGGLTQQMAQLKIQTELAKTTFERQERLWNQKIGSEIQYLQAKATFEAQQEAENQLKQQLSKTIVKAPFNGTIDEIITEQGSVVAPGQSQLIRIINLNEMYIETDVPENYLTSVVKNKKVTVSFPILGTTMEAKIRQAGNFINPANRTFKIEVAVPNKNKTIKPNLTAKLKINDYTNSSAYLIPQSIVSENSNGQQYIYVINNKNDNNEGVANRVIIETGKTQGDVIEVLKGLKDGDEIIDEGARSVKDGQTVKIINK